MTRADMERRLVKAEAISLAIVLVRWRKELLTMLKRRDDDAMTCLAKEATAILEESLRLHIEYRNQIMRELDAAITVDGGLSLLG